MEVKNFLKKLAEFYPPETKDLEKVQTILNEYFNTLSCEIDKICKKDRCKFDFDKLFELIKKNYKYTKLPQIPFILQYLPCAKVIEEKQISNFGKKTVFITKTGRIFPREVVGFGLTYRETIADLRKRYGNITQRTFGKNTWIREATKQAYVYNADGSGLERIVDLTQEGY